MTRIGNAPIWGVLVISTFILLAGCSPKVLPPEPEKTIEKLYAPYVSHSPERGESSWEKAAIDRGFRYSLLLNEPVIDYDPLVSAQDFSITNLRIEVDRPASAGKAHVLARFRNIDRNTTIGYDMILEDGAWKVDGIRSGNVDLRKSIDDALKPLGNPHAMEAPVERS